MNKGHKKHSAPESHGIASAADAATALTNESHREPGDEPAAAHEAEQQPPRGRFRSWVSDERHGYTRLTDQELRRIVLLFQEKPTEEILAAMKAGGFKYQPDYHGHKQAWVRLNDHEGRYQVEAIEKLIRGPVAAQDGPGF